MKNRDIQDFIVRIFYLDWDDTAAGLGFFVDTRRIITCAHVVNAAHGLAPERTSVPAKQDVMFDLPRLDPARALRAKVVDWRPRDIDLAVLELDPDADSPFEASGLEPSLTTLETRELHNRRFVVFGYASGDPAGEQIVGEIQPTAFDANQLTLSGHSASHYFIEKGFSGGPVVDADDMSSILGMVVSRTSDQDKLVGRMIPAETIRIVAGLASEKEINLKAVSADGRHREEKLPHGDVHFLGDKIEDLYEHVQERRFTPIIGSGCSLVGRSGSESWADISRAMATVDVALGDDEGARKYLKGLASIPAYAIPSGNPPLSPGRAAANPLFDLQVSLCRVGARLNCLFATAMVESLVPVWDTTNYRLDIRSDAPEFREMRSCLVTATTAAARADEELSEQDPLAGLGISGMYDHLVDLASVFAHEQDATPDGGAIIPTSRAASRVREDIDAHRRRQSRNNTHAAATVSIAVHELEWLADALWHTFRYDKAAYPRTDELAFQISLFADRFTPKWRGHTRRPELAAAAEIGQRNLTADIIATWYRRYSEEDRSAPHMLEFYDALARLLHSQFELYQSHETDLEPVAFSTTYDLELEAALYRQPACRVFHVFVPVHAFKLRRRNPRSGVDRSFLQPEMHWLMGTFTSDGDLTRPEWKLFPHNADLPPSRVQGPLIVKLHGSPLHKLPSPGWLGEQQVPARSHNQYDRVTHALIMSEGQYLNSILSSTDTVPDFFHNALQQDERALYFLGQSVTEWNTRLRMYDYVRRNHPGAVSVHDSAADAEWIVRVAINRSLDPYRSAVLRSLGIDLWTGELEEVGEAVQSALR